MNRVYTLVGEHYRKASGFVAMLPEGEPFELAREPANAVDRHAVQVWARGRHIGYVKAAENPALARAMDAAGGGNVVGALVRAGKIVKISVETPRPGTMTSPGREQGGVE